MLINIIMKQINWGKDLYSSFYLSNYSSSMIKQGCTDGKLESVILGYSHMLKTERWEQFLSYSSE